MKDEINLKLMGERIRAAREKANMTQSQLQEASHISMTQISAYENGKKAPGLDTLATIAFYTNSSLDELYFGTIPAIRSFSKGELIISCVEALFNEGVIKALIREEFNESVGMGGEYYYRIGFANYLNVLDDFVQELDRFEKNKEDYPNPDIFKKQIIAAYIKKINNSLN